MKRYEEKWQRKPYQPKRVLKDWEEIRHHALQVEQSCRNLCIAIDALTTGKLGGKNLLKVKRRKLLSSTFTLSKDLLWLVYILVDSLTWKRWESKNPDKSLDEFRPNHGRRKHLAKGRWSKKQDIPKF